MKGTITIVVITLAIIALVGAGIGWYSKDYFTDTIFAEDSEQLGGLSSEPINVIGTRTNTSTVTAYFGVNSTAGRSDTSTYPTLIGKDADSVVYYIGIEQASTTAKSPSAADLAFSILSSPDKFCAATSSSYKTAMNNYVTGDVKWFDASDHIRGATQETTYTGTGTIIWTNPRPSQFREIILDDLNAQCVALQVNGSSTEMWVQMLSKTN